MMVNENKKPWLKTYKSWLILNTVNSDVLWSIVLTITLKNKLLHHSFIVPYALTERMTFKKNND